MTNESLSIDNQPLPDCVDLKLLRSGPDDKIDPIISLFRYADSFIFYTNYINEQNIFNGKYTLEELSEKLYIEIGIENKLKSFFRNIDDPTIKARFLTTLFDLGRIVPIYKDFKKEIVEYQYYLELHKLSAETIALIKEVLPIYCKDMNNTPPRNL